MTPETFQTLAVAAVTYYATELSKRAKAAPELEKYRAGINRTVAALVSLIGTWGVVVTCQGGAATGYDCHASIPPLADLARFLTQWVATFFVSKLGWSLIRRPKG